MLSGEAAAWHELWRRVEPVVWAVSGKWQVSVRLQEPRRPTRNRVARDGALREGDFRGCAYSLHRRTASSDSAFRAWLATVAIRVAIDHVRAHPEHVDPRGRRGDERWAQLVPLDTAPELRDEGDLNGRTTALRLLEHARKELSVEQLTALHLWLEGVAHAAIAKRLKLEDERAAVRVVRAALKRLRDRYREARSDGDTPAEERT